MKQQRSIRSVTARRRQQAGDVLLDAMVAMLLAMVIGLGPVYVMSRSAVAQTQAAYQNMAVVEMRKLLADQGPALCGNTPSIVVNQVLSKGRNTTTTAVLTMNVVVTCTDRLPAGIKIGGVDVDPTGSEAAKTVSLSVGSDADDDEGKKAKALFGGGGVISITQEGIPVTTGGA